MQPTIIVLPSPEALAVAAAGEILNHARRAISDHGRFVIALTGGSTPEKTYKEIVSLGLKQKADWVRWFVFMGDDRHVPLEDSRSNFGMAMRTLLHHVPIPANQLFPIPTEIQPVQRSASEYDRTLRQFFGTAPPVFDLILLGLGDDGHTASLFPHAPALSCTADLVTSSPPGVLPPPVDRVTFTFPLLNAARAVLFLVGGANKARTMARVLDPAAQVNEVPAAGIRPAHGTLCFMLDSAAADALPPTLPIKRVNPQ